MDKNVIKINEDTLKTIVTESVKRILKEDFDSDDVFMTAYDIIQNGVSEIVQKHGVSASEAVQELMQVLNTFEGDDIYDDGDYDGEDEDFGYDNDLN